jgi:DNA-binding transcriptional MerR regulator
MHDRQQPSHRNRGAERAATGPARGNPLPRGSAARPAALPDPFRYTMNDLVAETGITARTIRFYIQQGLLPPAHGRGPGATYDAGHLVRLRAIALLKERHLPLAQIQERLANLSEQDLAAMLEVEEEPEEDTWRRIELLPDLELHVRERAGRKDYKLIGVVEMIKAMVRDQVRPEAGRPGPGR